jgi:hypothetical protein
MSPQKSPKDLLNVLCYLFFYFIGGIVMDEVSKQVTREERLKSPEYLLRREVIFGKKEKEENKKKKPIWIKAFLSRLNWKW